MIKSVEIGKFQVGPGQPCFIIAEAGVNHNGDIGLAKKLVHEAAKAGADAVKFQTFIPEQVIIPTAPKSAYQMQTTKADESQLAMLKKIALTYDNFRVLKELCDELGIIFLSTPASAQDADFLIDLGVPLLKVASMDVVNYPLLDYLGHKNLPLIVSTGMATLGEIESGLATIQGTGNNKLILLHCVTNYPIRDEEANLRVMDTLSQAFQVLVGFSDHTTSTVIPVAAVARGACVIEKHFTVDRTLYGPDHAASLEPSTFKDMVDGIRETEKALGSPIKELLQVEMENRKTMRRSIVAAHDLPEGTLLKHEDIELKRPGDGLGADFIPLLVGLKLQKCINKDSQISFNDIDWS